MGLGLCVCSGSIQNVMAASNRRYRRHQRTLHTLAHLLYGSNEIEVLKSFSSDTVVMEM